MKKIFFILVILFSFVFCYKSKDENFSASLLPLLFKEKKVNIVGDSLSQRSNGFSLSSKLGSQYLVTDFSISGRTQVDWAGDISRVFNPNPDILIIELGTNDAMNLPNSQFAQNLNILTAEIQKRSSAKIVLTAIPLTNDPILQERIKQNNQIVRSLSSHFTIADIEKEFEKAKIQIPLYPLIDSIHPEPVGYEIMGETYKLTILGL